MSEETPGRPVYLLPASAASAAGLTDAVRALLTALPTAAEPADAFRAAVEAAWARPHGAYRLAVLAADVPDLRARLQDHLDGTDSRDVVAGTGPATGAPSVAFLYSGQGGQYPGMGQGLYRTEPVFRAVVDRCAAAAGPHLPDGLAAALWPPAGAEPAQHRMLQAKLGTFAVSMALTALWASWNVRPSAVMGFTSGEYGAACASGAMSVEDAVALLACEARLTQRVDSGAMAVVTMSEADALAEIAAVRDKVGVAAVISESEVSLSGDATTLKALQEQAAAKDGRWVYLPVRTGLHSPLQAPSAGELGAAVPKAAFTEPAVPMVSVVTGGPVGAAALSDPSHWQRHLTGTARFTDGLRSLAALGCDTFVEVGPGRALTAIGPRTLPEPAGGWWASLGRSVDGRPPMLRTLSALYVRGHDVARPTSPT